MSKKGMRKPIFVFLLLVQDRIRPKKIGDRFLRECLGWSNYLHSHFLYRDVGWWPFKKLPEAGNPADGKQERVRGDCRQPLAAGQETARPRR